MARTRDPDVDRRIHEATVALLTRDGLAGLAIGEVASVAGVGKAAIYRRYRSKEDLVAGAVAAVLPLSQPPTDLVGAPALAAIVEDLRRALLESGGLRLLATLLVEETRHGELLELWRRRVVAPRVRVIGRVLAGTGQTVRLDPRMIGELALGGLVARRIARGAVPRSASDELARALWRLAIGDPTTTDPMEDESWEDQS